MAQGGGGDSAVARSRGRTSTAGETRSVGLEPVEGPLNDRIDEAYREKYRGGASLSRPVGDTMPLKLGPEVLHPGDHAEAANRPRDEPHQVAVLVDHR